MSLNQLCEMAESGNPKGLNIANPIGEATLGGITYQIQLQFICDKKAWIDENEITFLEVVKIHPPL